MDTAAAAASGPDQLSVVSIDESMNPFDEFLDDLAHSGDDLETAVERALQNPQPWLVDLRDLNADNDQTPEQFVMGVLWRYSSQKPCVFDDEKIRRIHGIANRESAQGTFSLNSQL